MTTTQVRTKPRVFYGWWIVAVGVVGAFLGSTTSQLFTGAMLPSIEQSTGWSRSSITLLVTLASIISGFSSPFWGRLVDRYGPRFISPAGAVVVAIGLLLMAISSSVHILVFCAGYMVARGVSQNTVSGVVVRTTVVNWFKRKRGRALGILSMATLIGGATLIPAARLIADTWGWEYAYVAFAVMMLAVMAPLALILLRRTPEEMGLRPDGDEPLPATAATKVAVSDEYDFSVSEAMRTPAFWMLLASQAVANFAVAGITFHQTSYFEDQGITVAQASLAVSVFALSGAFASGLWGVLVEHISERLLGATTLLVAGLLPLYLMTVDTGVEALVFAVLFGVTARGEGAIVAVIVAQYFGRGSYGTISSMSVPFSQVALGLGPTVAVLLYELNGNSYDLAFVINGALFALAGVLIFSARKPPRPIATPPGDAVEH